MRFYVLVIGSTAMAVALVGLQELPTSLMCLEGHVSQVAAVAFFKGDNDIVSASGDTTIRLWDVRKGKEIAVLHPPEGEYLGSEKSIGTIYDPVVGKRPPFLTCMAVSGDFKLLVVGAIDNSIRFWDPETKKQIRKIVLEPSGPFDRGNGLFAVAISPDNKQLAVAPFDKKIRLYSLETGTLIVSLEPQPDFCRAIAFSPDGSLLAGNSGPSITVWDVSTWKRKMVLEGHKTAIFGLAFSTNGQLLASSAGDVYMGDEFAELKLWDTKNGKECATLKGHQGEVRAVAFSPDSKLLVSGGGNAYDKRGEVILWDAEKGELLARLKGHANLVETVAFSPTGKLIASGGADRSIRVWETAQFVKNK